MQYTLPPSEPIAIVGSSCRFPGHATSPSKLWDLLLNPRDISKKIPDTRFNADGFYHVDGEHHGATNVSKSYFLEDDPRLFDSVFFNTAPREAEAIDPQQRLILEAVYEGMESAGYPMEYLQNTQTSCYVGLMTADYTDTQARDTEFFSQYMATGTSRSLISNRVSYFFDWHGPSMTVDTACSSSLTAVHLAIQNLRSGESRVSCAAGANLLLGPDLFIGASSLHMISPSGKSQMWDANADGYARGEGIATVFLKTLSNALADGDHIEALIRETGVNSDGRTQGITLPSSVAQAALIEQVYKKSGLNPNKASDRPQYFEAHGTGTPAGDPREASAISQSFFGQVDEQESQDKLFVGSIKTIIGHTEGAAGIAGLLKVSLAMQNRLIPPNQHFHILNPSVVPAYERLQVPTSPTPWPSLPLGCPVRASLNSFGFGGTNAHAIVESFEPEVHKSGPWGLHSEQRKVPVGIDIRWPVHLLLSANSKKSLFTTVEKYSAYLKGQKQINLRDLAWSLRSRRSALPVKAVFSGLTPEEIAAQMDKRLENARENDGRELGHRSQALPAGRHLRILGVFTGQGAQWPRMGRELILRSPLFNQTIKKLEVSLRKLPDPPDWSLKEEIIASADDSRLDEATLSQPLCTAIQVGLVDLLSTSGVKFHTVVGHSSGEIGAVYAAGLISAADAIRIAYYRGVYAKLAGGTVGQRGSMIATGLGVDSAKEFCDQPRFRNRLEVAASNSPTSSTLSGDEDAVNEAKGVFDVGGTFARLLKVDTAYHSHHMRPCADGYLASLQACKIHILEPDVQCEWVSSVYGLRGTPSREDLTGTYWRDNLVQTVLFSQAIERAVSQNGGFDIALEVGPHAALKGPVTQTMEELYGSSSPYLGLLDRKKNDIVAFGDAIGTLWIRYGSSVLDFNGFAMAFDDEESPKPSLLKPLPSYSWDHPQIFWRESRVSRQFRSRPDPPHELLGARTGDDTNHEPRWRNILKLNEIPWLKDHRYQGQVVVPASAYCVMALEASKFFCRDKTIKRIELHNINIERAISMNDDSQGTETLFSMRNVSDREINEVTGEEVILGEFNLSAASDKENNSTMRRICVGEVRLFVGEPPATVSLGQISAKSYLTPMNIDRFYASMMDIGLGYTGAFRGIISAERRLHIASATVEKLAESSTMSVHPTWLDVCFQTLLVAFASPGDTTLWTTFLPNKIGKVIFTSTVCHRSKAVQSTLHVDTCLTQFSHATTFGMPTITGDVHVFNDSSGKLEVQVENLTMASFAMTKESEDREMYLKNVWMQDMAQGSMVKRCLPFSSQEIKEIQACERVAYHYLRKLKGATLPKSVSGNQMAVFRFVDHVYASITNDRDQAIRSQLGSHSHEHIVQTMNYYSYLVDIQLMKTVGENLLSLVRGKTSMDEHINIEPLFDRLLQDGIGFSRSNQQLALAVKQVAHRYPRMKILEIGVGPASVTRAVLQALQSAFTSYTRTCTDTSFGSVVGTEKAFSNNPKIVFKTLNIEEDVTGQGFSGQSFDLVIASNVLHTASSLVQALKNIRYLMKPGGYLLLQEPTGDLLRFSLMMCGRPELWSRISDERIIKPTMSPVEWDSLLRNNDFGGVDSIAYDSPDVDMHTTAVMVTQAVDKYIHMLRHPLLALSGLKLNAASILVIGGQNLATARTINELQSIFFSQRSDIVTAKSFESLDLSVLPSIRAVVSLEDLDTPVIRSLTPKKIENMQQIFAQVRIVLWITNGYRNENPYHAATIGLGRSINSESPHLTLQFLDVDTTENIETSVAESLIRLLMAELPEFSDNSRLWTTEHEIVLQNGKILIPRVLPANDLNNRLNAVRRVITKPIHPEDATVIIAASGDMDDTVYSAREAQTGQWPAPKDHLRLRVTQCTTYPINVTDSIRLHVCIGSVVGNGDKVLAFASSNASFTTAPTNWQIPLSLADEKEAELLEEVARQLSTRFVLSVIGRVNTAIVFEPDDQLASTIQKAASDVGKKPVFLTSTAPPHSSSIHWNFVSPFTPRRMIRSLVPLGTSLLLNLSAKGRGEVSRIQEYLPASCSTINFCENEILCPDDTSQSLQEILSSTLNASERNYTSCRRTSTASVVIASDLIARTQPVSAFTIVDWANTSVIPTLQRPIDASMFFSANKSYLLVGLTGELGQSICKWMVEHGARQLVVSSRTPLADPKWKEEIQDMGAIVEIVPMDVSDREVVITVCEDIQSRLPPVAGVMNGAMVLSDGLFEDMTLASMEKVFKPKVDGSKNLDEVFSHQQLDFFIMFSSLSAVIGNPGQATYSAANMFMAGLAAQRRKRGLAASVLDIGMILGTGYIQRADGGVEGLIETSLRKQNYMPMAERDIHQTISEAILAGVADSGQDPEIITGLKRLDLSAMQQPSWHSNPRFSHHVVESNESEVEGFKGATKGMQQQLSAAKDNKETSETLQKFVADQLASLLQLPRDGIDIKLPIIDLGIDSLIAVEIRSWFLKEVKEDVPVLKILGGASVEDLSNELAPKILSAQTDIPGASSTKERDGQFPKAPSSPSSPRRLSSSTSEIGTLTNESSSLTPLSLDSQLDLDDKQQHVIYNRVDKMSFGQSRLWFPSIYLQDQTTYNCTTSYRLSGPLDISRFENSLAMVIKRHDTFRTSFFTDPSTGQGTQAISDKSTFKLKKLMNATDPEDVDKEFWHAERHRYDLEAGDVFIATLLRHSPGSHTIIFGYHHIIMDGVSWQLFLQDIDKFYSSVSPNLPSPNQYVDFAIKQRNISMSGGFKDERAYWKTEFPDLPAPLPLFPFAKVGSRKPLTRYETRNIIVDLKPSLVTKIKRASHQAKTTTFHFYISTLQVLLHQFLDVEDLCIGVADANRTDQDFMDTIGFLLNFLPLRFNVNKKQRFSDILRNTRTRVYAALGNSAVPFDTIVQDLNVPSSTINPPLFQVLINYRMGALKQNTMGDLKLDFLAYEDAKNPFDFALSIDEKEDGSGMLTLSLLKYLFDTEGGDLIMDTYLHLLEELSTNISVSLSEVSLFNEPMTQEAINLGIGSKTDFNWPDTLSHRIDHLIRTQPEDISVKDTTGRTLTYSQLSERANAVAHALANSGIIRGSYVALFCEQSVDVVCSLLAIMRLGAVYIPLDVRSSPERLGSIITEARPRAVICHDLTHTRTRKFESRATKVLNISRVPMSVKHRIANSSQASDPAFLLFTSGSTGKPKGILLTNSNYVTQVQAASERLCLDKEVVLQQSALGFDASLAQIFYGLANGGTIVMASNRGDPSDLTKLMLDEKVTFTLCVPSEYSVLLQYGKTSLEKCHSWRVAMCGGEAFAPNLKAKFRNLNLPNLKVFNAYGPSEVSVASSIGEVLYKEVTAAELEKVPIGPPLSDYAVHILDENLKPVPIGWPGEICISGPAVALEYFQNKALTATKFVNNDFIGNNVRSNGEWNRMYCTGDRGRMLKQGEVIFLGRKEGDLQIKLRGIRVELGDISSTILEMSRGTLIDASIGVRGQSDQFLVAYVVFSNEHKHEGASDYLRELLRSLPLPSYMRPAFAVPLDFLPMTSSGKLDTKALSSLPIPNDRGSKEEEDKLTEAEIQVKNMWEKVLSGTGGPLEIKKHSDFFSVGGNSLLLLRLQVEIRETFQTDIPMAELFQITSLKDLAARIFVDGPSGYVENIDWEVESSLPADILAISPQLSITRNPREHISVLLTGSTGFLGQAILKQLVDHSAVSQIICVAVRENSSRKARQPEIQSPKIIIHPGDLSLPLLGMTEEEAAQAFEDVDVIIHNGADVSFMKTYQSLRQSNVESTKVLAKFALAHRLPIHYISTAGIAHLRGNDPLEETSVASSQPAVDGSDGYVASKWASERFLEKFNERYNLPVWIHRPASIIGENAPSMDIMNNTLRFSRIMKAVPRMTGWSGFFDLIAVDSVAKSVVGEALVIGHRQQPPPRQTVPAYIHHSGETVIPIDGFREYLEQEEKCEYRTLGLRDWTKAATQLGLDDLVAAFLGTIPEEGGLNMPLLVNSKKDVRPAAASTATSFFSSMY